ncbi:MAG TPA: hypothetical protein VJK50_04150 [Patescibacteria group bacterium]|nr:hypothetical protein [Patescibacteria group bacterium]
MKNPYNVPETCIDQKVGILLPRAMSGEIGLADVLEFNKHMLRCESCLTLAQEANRLAGRNGSRPNTRAEWVKFLNGRHFKKWR